jgi:hypothetical protein
LPVVRSRHAGTLEQGVRGNKGSEARLLKRNKSAVEMLKRMKAGKLGNPNDR